MRIASWKESPFYENVLLRTVTYYAVMGSIAWMVREYTPTAWGVLGGEEASALIGSGTISKGQAAAEAALRASQPAAVPAIVAMVTAFVTALPVAWVYTLTRNRKGYQQSVVQTMIILPVIIAGIVGAVLFVLTLVLLVKWVVGSGVAS